MSYANSVLVSGERIVYVGRFHWLDKIAAFILCFIVVGVFLVIRMWSTEMTITNRRLIYKRGWISRKTEEMGLQRIGEVNLRQGIFGRIWGYGQVQVQGVGASGMSLPSMGSPMKFKRALEEARSKMEAG